MQTTSTMNWSASLCTAVRPMLDITIHSLKIAGWFAWDNRCIVCDMLFVMCQYAIRYVPMCYSLCANMLFIMCQYAIRYVPMCYLLCINVLFVMHQYALCYASIWYSWCAVRYVPICYLLYATIHELCKYLDRFTQKDYILVSEFLL